MDFRRRTGGKHGLDARYEATQRAVVDAMHVEGLDGQSEDDMLALSVRLTAPPTMGAPGYGEAPCN
jgi:hypothetical protein